MTNLNERIVANMDVVLEEVCRGLPHGGDHETRSYIAKKLLNATKKRNTTLDGLRGVARSALEELTPPRSNTSQIGVKHRRRTAASGSLR